MTGEQPQPGGKLARWWGVAQGACHALSLGWLVFVAACYAWRTPSNSLLTVYPAWVWAAFGLPLALLGWRRRARRRGVVVLGAWALLCLCLSEEARIPLGWVRPDPGPRWLAARAEGRALRVVTANCGGGIPEAAEEALSYEPDIVLLQESPGPADLDAIVSRHPDYSAVHGLDVSILARGEAERLPSQGSPLVVTGAAVTVDGRAMTVVNAHLHLPYLYGRFWSPSGWRLAREAFLHRSEQMGGVDALVAAADPSLPLVVGGDWNTPPGDLLFRPFRGRLRDSFREAGRGLGSTIVNDLPLSRIDHIYIDRHLTAASVVARRTVHSDHRFVVADLIVRE
jgi:vancomycin resistance protein VanJ